MTTSLLHLLIRLHQAAPDVCQVVTGTLRYSIAGYEFWAGIDETFYARANRIGVFGKPALDWLAGALMAAMSEKGFERVHMHYNGRTDLYSAMVLKSAEDYSSSYPDHVPTLAEALLTALVAALEAERVR